MSSLDEFELQSRIRVVGTSERGKIVGKDDPFLIIEFPRGEIVRLLPREFKVQPKKEVAT